MPGIDLPCPTQAWKPQAGLGPDRARLDLRWSQKVPLKLLPAGHRRESDSCSICPGAVTQAPRLCSTSLGPGMEVKGQGRADQHPQRSI